VVRKDGVYIVQFVEEIDSSLSARTTKKVLWFSKEKKAKSYWWKNNRTYSWNWRMHNECTKRKNWIKKRQG